MHLEFVVVSPFPFVTASRGIGKDTVTHAGSYLCALSEPTLLWAAKGVLYLHVGGTVTHRADKVKPVYLRDHQANLKIPFTQPGRSSLTADSLEAKYENISPQKIKIRPEK